MQLCWICLLIDATSLCDLEYDSGLPPVLLFLQLHELLDGFPKPDVKCSTISRNARERSTVRVVALQSRGTGSSLSILFGDSADNSVLRPAEISVCGESACRVQHSQCDGYTSEQEQIPARSCMHPIIQRHYQNLIFQITLPMFESRVFAPRGVG